MNYAPPPLPQAATESLFWLIPIRRGQVEGPYPISHIAQLYERGAITAEARVCKQGNRTWKALEMVLPLHEMMPESPPPLPAYTPARKPWMSRRDKIILYACLIVVGGGLLTVLAWAGLENLKQRIKAHNDYVTAKEQEQRAVYAEQKAKMEAYWKTPEGQAKQKEMEEKRRIDLLAQQRVAGVSQSEKTAVSQSQLRSDDDRWEAIASAFESAGARVVRDGNHDRMVVVIPSSLAEQLSSYQLKMLAQAAYSRLGESCVVRIQDEFGTNLSKAWLFGASSSK